MGLATKMTVATSLTVPKQASLYFQPIDWRRKNLAPVIFQQCAQKYQLCKIILQSFTHILTASNSINMDSSLLQTVGLSSNYDAVHFGGDLGREEDEKQIHGTSC